MKIPSRTYLWAVGVLLLVAAILIPVGIVRRDDTAADSVTADTEISLAITETSAEVTFAPDTSTGSPDTQETDSADSEADTEPHTDSETETEFSTEEDVTEESSAAEPDTEQGDTTEADSTDVTTENVSHDEVTTSALSDTTEPSAVTTLEGTTEALTPEEISTTEGTTEAPVPDEITTVVYETTVEPETAATPETTAEAITEEDPSSRINIPTDGAHVTFFDPVLPRLNTFLNDTHDASYEIVMDQTYGSVLKLTATEDAYDPHLMFRYDRYMAGLGVEAVSADDYKYVVLTVRMENGGEDIFELFHYSGAMQSVSPECRVSATYADTDGWQRIVFDLSSQEWAGSINGFRLDFLSAPEAAGQSVYIYAMDFFMTAEEAFLG